MKFEMWENQQNQTFEFRGSYSQADLINLSLDPLQRACLNQPISKKTPMADHLLNLELIFRNHELKQLEVAKEKSHG